MAWYPRPPLRGWRSITDRSPLRDGRLPQLTGGAVPQTLMRPLAVVPVQPALHLGLSLSQGMEQFGVQQLFPLGTMKAFHMTVVKGLAFGHRFILHPPGAEQL